MRGELGEGTPGQREQAARDLQEGPSRGAFLTRQNSVLYKST